MRGAHPGSPGNQENFTIRPCVKNPMLIEGIILERDSISRIEIGTRFVADYELMIFAKVLKVSVEWLLFKREETS